MASIQTGGGSGKKSVDQEIPLVPFIDLLLCCVMFLLVTAVWNQLAAVNVSGPGATTDPTALPNDEPDDRLILEVGQSGYVLASTDGVRQEIPALEGMLDNAALRERLEERRRLAPRQAQLLLAPDDDIDHGALIAVMDVALGAGFEDVSFSSHGSAL